MDQLGKYAKAIVAALVPAVLMFLAFRSDGVTAGEWETIVMTALGGFGFTWAVPNAPSGKAATVVLDNSPLAGGLPSAAAVKSVNGPDPLP